MTLWRIVWLCLSLVPLTPAVAGPAHFGRALSDARLEELVEHLAGEGGKKAEAALREAGLQRVLPRLTRLQRETPKNQELCFDLAFALAYFGVDYQRNVRRLAALDELWNRGDSRWQQYVSEGSDMRDSIPGLMATLYERNHDPALLRTLFTWRLDGGAAEVLSDVCFHLARRYPLPVLQAIRGNLERRQRVMEAISLDAGPGQYRTTLVRLRSAARRAGLEQFMRRFIRQMELYSAILNNDYQLFSRLVKLGPADLSDMDLGGMELIHCNLAHANLRRTNLSDSDLSGAQLHGADLRGARYNRRTLWPRGFDPRKRGAILVAGPRSGSG